MAHVQNGRVKRRRRRRVSASSSLGSDLFRKQSDCITFCNHLGAKKARLGVESKRPSAHNTDHMCLISSTFPSYIIMSLSISNQEVWFITTSYQSLYESIDEARWYVSAQSGHNNLSWQAGWYWHYASLLTYLWLPSLPRNHDIFFLVLQATIFENYQKCLILQHCKTRLFEYFFKHYARISWTLLSRIWRDADTVSKCPSPPFSMAFVEIWSQRHSLRYYRAFTTCSTLFPDP